MLDTTLFLTELYVMCEDFCKGQSAPVVTPGPGASLCPSEVLTLGMFSQ